MFALRLADTRLAREGHSTNEPRRVKRGFGLFWAYTFFVSSLVFYLVLLYRGGLKQTCFASLDGACIHTEREGPLCERYDEGLRLGRIGRALAKQ